MTKYAVWIDKRTVFWLSENQLNKPKYVNLFGSKDKVKEFIANYNPLQKNFINGY